MGFHALFLRSSPRKRGPMNTGLCSWVPALALRARPGRRAYLTRSVPGCRFRSVQGTRSGCPQLRIPITMRWIAGGGHSPFAAKLARETRMSANVTEVLAGFAASLQYDDIPERVRDHCKNLLLDTLACAVAGHRGEETQQIAALASGLAQSNESSVIGGEALSLAGATLLNGYLVTAVTMCDVHRPTLTHVTPEVMPPALAIAERDGLSGRELLVAIAAGCEVTTRVGVGLDYSAFRGKGWHGPGVLGPFGAAAAVGRLRRFDAETMARAFGLAGSQAAGTFAAWGTPTVKFHQCRGALSGLIAALLAEQEFLATREFLTAKDGGLYNVYANGGHPEAVTADLGKAWELEQIALRLWPSASSIQGMNTALFDLIERHNIDPAREIGRAHV